MAVYFVKPLVRYGFSCYLSSCCAFLCAIDSIDGRNLPQLITAAAFRGRNLLALPMHLRVHRVLWKPPR
jgi:hypothetical protein